MPAHRTFLPAAATTALLLLLACGAPKSFAAQQGPETAARQILEAGGVEGGLVVHVGCGDGRLTAALRPGTQYLVHGLERDAAMVAPAREHVDALGLYGAVSIERWSGPWLPYADNLVNLFVIDPRVEVQREEIMRALAPGGAAVWATMKGGRASVAEKAVKPWPEEIDPWSHYLHGPNNNAVADDSRVGPPRHMQWLAGPRWTRHHDWLNSLSAAVTSGGRLFYIFDEASPANMNLPSRWAIVARDGFSGVTLWKRPMPSWVHHRRRFRSGPPQVTRLLVASPRRVYLPLRLSGPVTALDATTGQTVATYEATEGAEEIILVDDTLLVLKGEPVAEQAFSHKPVQQQHRWPNRKTLVAVDVDSGDTQWRFSPEEQPAPETLASDGKSAYMQLDGGVVCLDMESGKVRWRYETTDRLKRGKITYGKQVLVVADGVVVCNIGDELVALAADDGRRLWACEAGTAFHAPVDVFVVDGLVWHKLGHQMDPMRVPPDAREAHDLHTGELKHRDSVAEYLITPGHHFRCYRAKATERFLILGKRGVEMVDLAGSNHTRSNWLRGSCQYGILPANGLLYTPPHSCGCYAEAMFRGFSALAARQRPATEAKYRVAEEARLAKGPAYGKSTEGERPAEEAWPMYRHDPLRSGVATTPLPDELGRLWTAELRGRLTQPVVAAGCVVAADADAGIVYCLDARDGRVRWKHFAGSRVDSPPVVHRGTVLFGSADGRVTCLRLADGALAWRFLAAPADVRAVAMDRLESPWPVHGGVLLLDGKVYCCAGRSTWLDGGMYLYALDPATGHVVHQRRLKNEPPEYREPQAVDAVHIRGHLWTDFKTFTQSDRSDTYSIAGGVSDVLVSDGEHVFIRHLMFDPALNEKTGRSGQLFSTTTLLDGAEHHRGDWGIGLGEHDRLPASRNKGGFSRYRLKENSQPPPYRSFTPTGLMLAFDDGRVWGVQRARRRQTLGDYLLFQKALDAGPKDYAWRRELPVRPRAMLVAGHRLVLGVMPKQIPKDDPHAAYEGRLGGALWVCSAGDGSKQTQLELPCPVVWDGMAAANGRLLVSLENGTLACFGE